jgi:membrane protein implicated in regulation of membrane protease activity
MTTNDRSRASILRYFLWQIPGWLAAGALLTLLVAILGAPWWVVPGGVVVLIARDIAFYPAMRAVFRPARPARPIGARGVVVEDLRPVGMVRVQGELWQAEAIGDAIPAPQVVVVADARGLTLLVERADRV